MNPLLRRTVVSTSLSSLRVARPLALRSPRGARQMLTSRMPVDDALARLGEWRLAEAIRSAQRDVPAYRSFVRAKGGRGVRWHGLRPDFTRVPVMDKANYVKQYSVEDRCHGGRLPAEGVTIDESSGTSGIPSNWVRGPGERADMRAMLNVSGRMLLGEEPVFVINAFALGPWATGMTISMALSDLAILKSTGPDIAKISNTLKLFGPAYRYMICGYPPFLKALVDSADIDWEHYSCIAFVGGEGMSEGLRAHLRKAFSFVYSSFGASDLEINIAAENDFTIAVRQLLGERQDLRELLGLAGQSSLPMVFQYNPLDYFIESNEDFELIISVTRPDMLSPKIRYNIHDLGTVRRFDEVEAALKKLDLWSRLTALRPFRLPLLFHYGRSDHTVAFYGANVMPADIDEVIFRLEGLSDVVQAHALILGEDSEANKTLEIALELKPGRSAGDYPPTVRADFLAMLAAVNQDYRGAAGYIPQGMEPGVVFYDHRTGPFEEYDIRLKRQYVVNRAP